MPAGRVHCCYLFSPVTDGYPTVLKTPMKINSINFPTHRHKKVLNIGWPRFGIFGGGGGQWRGGGAKFLPAVN